MPRVVHAIDTVDDQLRYATSDTRHHRSTSCTQKCLSCNHQLHHNEVGFVDKSVIDTFQCSHVLHRRGRKQVVVKQQVSQQPVCRSGCTLPNTDHLGDHAGCIFNFRESFTRLTSSLDQRGSAHQISQRTLVDASRDSPSLTVSQQRLSDANDVRSV